ncbi:hypothetical protein BH11BAC3_BH11BAC3_13560 [soil metagenome]
MIYDGNEKVDSSFKFLAIFLLFLKQVFQG